MKAYLKLTKGSNNLCNLDNLNNYDYLGDFYWLELVFFQLSDLNDGESITEAEDASSSRRLSTIKLNFCCGATLLQLSSEATECLLLWSLSARCRAASAGVLGCLGWCFSLWKESLKYTFHNHPMQRFFHNDHNSDKVTWALSPFHSHVLQP